MAAFTTKPVTKATWSDLEILFEGRGGPKHCWCMVWRPLDGPRQAVKGPGRKRALKAMVEARTPVGLVGYHDGEPVAWCSIAPRDTHIKLSEAQDDGEEGVWSVTCFFIRRDHRGQGLSAQMLEAAIAHAKKRGAKVVESYPVDPDSPSYRFMGFVPLYQSHGFTPAGRTGKRRHVMRLEV